jgi:lysozyme
MTVAGLNMVKSFEGFYSKMYRDVAGIPTIGYGTLCKDNLIPCDRAVSEPDAARVLGNDLVRKYSGCVRSVVKAPLNNNQFSALVSFAYNAGCGAMTNVATYARLNAASGANYQVVPSRMALYNKARVRGVLTVVNGLVRRRKAEGDLFVTAAASACMPAARLQSGAPIVNAASVGSAAHDNLVSIDGRRPFLQRVPAPKPDLSAHHLFNLRRNEVDLPPGTVLTFPGIPGATDKPIIVKADIATAVRGLDTGIAANRGPIGRMVKPTKAERKAARKEVRREARREARRAARE